MGTFGVQYWYYAELEQLGQAGRIRDGLSVLVATRRVMQQQRNWLSARRAGGLLAPKSNQVQLNPATPD